MALTPEQARWVENTAAKVPLIARSLARLLKGVSTDDLVSAGHEALVQAALRYDPSNEVPFSSFAHYRIRGAMIDTARSMAPGSRRLARARRALTATQALLEDSASARIADRRPLEQRVAAARALVERAAATVLLVQGAQEADSVADEHLGDPEESLLHSEAHERAWKLVAALPPSDRALLEAIHLRGQKLSELAAAAGTSISTVSRRHTRLIAELAAQMRTA